MRPEHLNELKDLLRRHFAYHVPHHERPEIEGSVASEGDDEDAVRELEAKLGAAFGSFVSEADEAAREIVNEALAPYGREIFMPSDEEVSEEPSPTEPAPEETPADVG